MDTYAPFLFCIRSTTTTRMYEYAQCPLLLTPRPTIGRQAILDALITYIVGMYTHAHQHALPSLSLSVQPCHELV